ncbi:mediator of RNA polymerase II transcription subunit 11-like [Halichondria panicea]|uniref:mediator of RNA polymerase II transcription subunit 11-like n=1 Tax=Halichondria panicea TaxID=6063 RepID=UPI00312B428E
MTFTKRSYAIMETAQRLEKLQRTEQEVCRMLSLAADSIQELSRDNPDQGLVDHKTKEFVKVLEAIEGGLSEQISYLTRVSTHHPHEGSAYGAEKDYELVCIEGSLVREQLLTSDGPHMNNAIHNSS